jgi:hypothetical protein
MLFRFTPKNSCWLCVYAFANSLDEALEEIMKYYPHLSPVEKFLSKYSSEIIGGNPCVFYPSNDEIIVWQN